MSAAPLLFVDCSLAQNAIVCAVIVESHTVAKDEIISGQGQMGSHRALSSS
jgi:hypothetical protein